MPDWEHKALPGAHPRSRGENPSSTTASGAGSGSSPLTRGKRLDRLSVGEPVRLIPAHAGKTQLTVPSGVAGSAHPRSRGENRVALTQLANAGGSSPLTRGKHGGHGLADADRGLIPAHAGKTMRPGRDPSRPSGSSPLTRGKRERRRGRSLLQRLIPAHAGKTQRRSGVPALLKAHPRSRGENRLPPRRHRIRPWLIPAHAGKTVEDQAHRIENAAHPRSRGENWRTPWIRLAVRGSSPLTRGKLHEGTEDPTDRRLIPAHAGKTPRLHLSICDWPAHPRSRGENLAPRSPRADAAGSSPLTRGKH